MDKVLGRALKASLIDGGKNIKTIPVARATYTNTVVAFENTSETSVSQRAVT